MIKFWVNKKVPGVIDINLLLIFFINVRMYVFHSLRLPLVARAGNATRSDTKTSVKFLVDNPSPIMPVLHSEREKEYRRNIAYMKSMTFYYVFVRCNLHDLENEDFVLEVSKFENPV